MPRAMLPQTLPSANIAGWFQREYQRTIHSTKKFYFHVRKTNGSISPEAWRPQRDTSFMAFQSYSVYNTSSQQVNANIVRDRVTFWGGIVLLLLPSNSLFFHSHSWQWKTSKGINFVFQMSFCTRKWVPLKNVKETTPRKNTLSTLFLQMSILKPKEWNSRSEFPKLKLHRSKQFPISQDIKMRSCFPAINKEIQIFKGVAGCSTEIAKWTERGQKPSRWKSPRHPWNLSLESPPPPLTSQGRLYATEDRHKENRHVCVKRKLDCKKNPFLDYVMKWISSE